MTLTMYKVAPLLLRCCRAVFLSVALFSLSAPLRAEGNFTVFRPPLMRIDTPHFIVLYQERLAPLAPRLAKICEEAYADLNQVLGYAPSERTTFIFVDNADLHNGGTSVIPHNTVEIIVSAAPPELETSIYQTPEYLRRTIYHELTHVFTLDLRTGLAKSLSDVFGKTIPNDPFTVLLFYFGESANLFAPSWYLEGAAVWAETDLTPPGRGRSSFVDAYFRTAVRDNTLLRPSQWSLNNPSWPYGSAAYFYGMRMMQFYAEQAEAAGQHTSGQLPAPVGKLTEDGANHVLFNALRSFAATSEQDWQATATEMLNAERERQKANLAKLARAPLTPTPRLTPTHVQVNSPLWVGQKVAFVAQEEERRMAVWLFDPASGQSRRLSVRHHGIIGTLAVSHDGQSLYYSYLAIEKLQNVYFHINKIDLHSGRETPVARRGRYRSFDISPDGKHFVAAAQRDGAFILIEAPLEHAGDAQFETVLLRASFDTVLDAPRYSPDGRWISFVEGGRQHRILMLRSGAQGQAPISLLSQKAIIFAPSWQADGQALLFSSDENGVFNLYRSALTWTAEGAHAAAPQALSNVDGALLRGEADSAGQRIAAASMDGHGVYLTLLSANAAPKQPLAQIAPQWARPPDCQPAGVSATEHTTSPCRVATNAASTSSADEWVARPYASLASIRGDFWAPWLESSSISGTRLGVQGQVSDPAGYQQLYGAFGSSSRYGLAVGALSYVYSGLVPQLSAYASSDVVDYPGLLTSNGLKRNDYAERDRIVGAAITLPLSTSLSRQITAQFGLQQKKRNALAEFSNATAASINPPETGRRRSLYGVVEYDSTTDFGRSVSRERGAHWLLAEDLSRPEDASAGSLRRRLISDDLYLPTRWDNQVVKLGGLYGGSSGTPFAQGAYSLGGLPSSMTSQSSNPNPFDQAVGLRGYASNAQVGGHVERWQAAYRFPLWNRFSQSESGFPIYNRSLMAEVFYEQGRVWDAPAQTGQIGWLHSTGVELRYGLSFLRYLDIAPGLGLAYARDNPQLDPSKRRLQAYFSLSVWAGF